MQGGGSVSVGGESNLTISNATVVGSLFGGNFANKLEYATKDVSMWNGNTNITINATERVVIGVKDAETVLYYADTDNTYKFYKDDNALKVAKLA